jgi:hypothetical protein
MSSESFLEYESDPPEVLSPEVQALLEHRLMLYEQHPEDVRTTDEVTEGIRLLKAKIEARAGTSVSGGEKCES